MTKIALLLTMFGIGVSYLAESSVVEDLKELYKVRRERQTASMSFDEHRAYQEVNANSPMALFLAAEYYHHRCFGIERDTEKGKEYYVKALNAYRHAVEGRDLDPSDKYRFARCIEFGLGQVADAKEWYVAAAESGHTNAMRRVMAYRESEGGRGEIPESFAKVPEIWTPDAKAKHGAHLYESEETREKGLVFLHESAQEGSPFAMARLSALFYLGEGGVEKDLEMALRLMNEAVAKGFPENQLPIEQVQKKFDRLVDKTERQKAGKEPPPVLPGHGYPGKIEPYDETAELKNKMAHNETVMDIENNAVGRMIGSGSYTNLIQVQNAVIDALNKGILTILDDLKNVNEIGLLQPSNQ